MPRKKKEPVVEVAPVEAAPVAEEIKVSGEAPIFPIPKEFVKAVNEILNQKFTPQIEYASDAPNFQFTVFVPREYSNASGGHWDMYHEDRRAKVLPNAMGLMGVKEFLTLVYQNLEPEVRARIVAERVITS